MPVSTTAISGVLIVRWDTFPDVRGFFRQTYQVSEIEAALGREVRFRQGNHARSAPRVVRGFHAEPWDKLVYVSRGTAFAAVADTRPESATFGTAQTFLLGDPPGERVRLFVAEGLANSYGNCGETDVDYLYDVTAEYSPVDKRAVAWNDPDLAVAWPITRPIVSEADQSNPTLRELFPTHPRWA